MARSQQRGMATIVLISHLQHGPEIPPQAVKLPEERLKDPINTHDGLEEQQPKNVLNDLQVVDKSTV